MAITMVGRPRNFDRTEALQAALKVFFKHGFQHTSLDDLTKAMGINRPSLYSAFGNKEQLFLETLSYYHQTYLDYTCELFGSDRGAAEVLSTWLEWIVENQEVYSGCFIANSSSICADQCPKIAGKISDLLRLNTELLTKFLEMRRDRGELSKLFNVEDAAFYLNIQINGLAVLTRSGNKLIHKERMIKLILGVLQLPK